MRTTKEQYLEFFNNGGKLDQRITQYDPIDWVLNDPCTAVSLSGRKYGGDAKDAWGVTHRWKEGDHASIPYITDETKVCPDVTEWKKYCHAPKMEFEESEWDAAKAKAEEIRKDGKLVGMLMATGIFEQSHFLMGFEDTLMNFYIEPDSLKELFSYICDYRMQWAEKIIRHIHPDVLLCHDDWGAKDRLFFDPDIFREFLKPLYEKYYGYCKQVAKEEGYDLILMHHADSHCAEIIDDFADMHIDIWQGVLPSNNVPELLDHLKGKKPYLMGGIDAGIVDSPFSTDEDVVKEVTRTLTETEGKPGFIPCITYGLAESIKPGVYEKITEVIEKWNEDHRA